MPLKSAMRQGVEGELLCSCPLWLGSAWPGALKPLVYCGRLCLMFAHNSYKRCSFSGCPSQRRVLWPKLSCLAQPADLMTVSLNGRYSRSGQQRESLDRDSLDFSWNAGFLGRVQKHSLFRLARRKRMTDPD